MQIKKLLLTLLTLVCTVLAGQAEVWTYNAPTSGNGPFPQNVASGSGTLKNTTADFSTKWTFKISGSGKNLTCLSYGLHFGSGSTTVDSLNLYTESFNAYIVKKVTITTKTACASKITVSVGGSKLQCNGNDAISFTAAIDLQPLTFVGSGQGPISINWKNSGGKGAFYVKQIAIEYENAPAITPTDATFGWKDAAGNAVTSWVKPLKDAQLPTFSASGTHEDGTALDLTKIAYSTSNPAVVNYEGGKFVAKGTGTTTLTAKLTGDKHFNDFTSSIDVTLNGACAPATVSPDNTLPILEGNKLTFTCPQEGAKLNLMVGDDFMEEGLALPYEYTLTTSGTYEVGYWTSCQDYSDSETTTLTYEVIPVGTVGEPVLYIPSNSEVSYQMPFSITAVNAAKMEVIFNYTDGMLPASETQIAEGENICFLLSRDCAITVNAYRADNTIATTKSATYTIQRPNAPTFSVDGTKPIAYESNLMLTAAQGCTLKYQIGFEAPITMPQDATSIMITQDCTIKAWSILPNGYISQATSVDYKILRPTAPEFSIANNAEIEYGTQLTITVPMNARVRYKIDAKEVLDKFPVDCEGGHTVTIPLQYDGTITAWSVLPNGYTNEGTAAVTYTIRRPAAPTFDIAETNVEQGTYVTITAPEGTYIYYNIAGGEYYVDESSATIQIIEDTSITACSLLENGYRSAEVKKFYRACKPAPAVKPIPSAANGESLLNNTEITFTSDNADKMVLKAYAFDGSFTTTEADGNTIKGTFTSDIRRFVVQGIRDVYGDNDGTGPTLDVMYNIASSASLVKNESQLYEGMKFIIAAPKVNNIDYYMTRSRSSDTRWTGNRTTITAYGTIPSVPANAAVITLEKSDKEGEWYLSTIDSVTNTKVYLDGSTEKALGFKDTPVSSVIEFKSDGEARIKFASTAKQAASQTFWINMNSTYKYFLTYSGSQSACYIYEYNEAVEPTPVVTFKHRRFDWRGFHDPETEHATEAVTDAEGVTTYTAQGVYNLAGDFKLFMNGTAVGGHIDQAKTNFDEGHGYAELSGTNCVGEHAPYVFVDQNTAYTLQTAKEGQDFLPLSTSPDRYHYGSYVHTNPIVKVMHKPYHSLQLRVEGEAGGTVTSVANVAVDADAPVMLFNLQGQPVDAANPAPGIYLRRQGSRTDKVVIE